MAILNNNPLVGASGNQGGYNINNSLRFRSSASAYLSRTPASNGDRQKWTWSGWVKRGALSSAGAVISCGSYSTNLFQVYFDDSTNKILIQNFPNSTTPNVNLHTSQVFRDPSAWYHIVIAIDTTQATAANRVKMYVNGNQVTSFSTETYPAQNATPNWNTGSLQHNLGARDASTLLFDGYMADINFIDGSAKTPSDFGETDTTTGVWKPKAYTGTYGTNGFYLKFSDIATTSGSNAGLGKDFSGNSNYWTTNNISVTSGTTYDAMTDVPTNTSATVANYAVWSPLVGSVGLTLSQANLSATFDTAGGTRYGTIGTIGVSSGKWYWEYEFSAGGNSALLGITQKPFAVQMGTYPGEQTGDYGYFGSNGNKYTAGSGSAYGATFTTGDIIGVALDLDAGTLTFYKNNTSQGTAFSSISGTFFPAIGKGITATGITSFVNFGQRPFAYTPPTGFVALNTYNLPTPTILQGNKYMDATLYTGNSSTQTITNAGAFKPDLVWLKCRSTAGTWNNLVDSVRGASKTLYSNTTNAEGTDNYLSAFNSNGFGLNVGDSGTNTSGNTYVAWQWQAGQGSTSSNTSGSITSTVSVNATAGFSVVTWTGNGTIGATVGHGLGVAPSMIIVKQRNSTESWATYHKSLGATQYLNLNQTMAAATSITRWNNTTPSSTVITFYNDAVSNGSGSTYVAYCFAEISGYSKFGSYTGNGSADGPFVYLGFRPKWIMVKSSSYSAADTHWHMLDTSRNTANPEDKYLNANTSGAEDTYTFFDILSNGFKLRQNGASFNGSGTTYIYAAFAENPTKFALAR